MFSLNHKSDTRFKWRLVYTASWFSQLFFVEKNHMLLRIVRFQSKSLTVNSFSLLLLLFLKRFNDYNKPNRHVVCAGALGRVKPIPLSCANGQCMRTHYARARDKGPSIK